MRDPNRIDKFCDELAELWHKVPDWRFGQFMINMMSHYMSEHGRDVFYVEDNELMLQMKSWFQNNIK